MKTFPAIINCLWIAAAVGADHTAWQWQSTAKVGQRGMLRLELPPPVLDVSRSDLGDLRVVSPAGVETPYWLVPARVPAPPWNETRGFTALLDAPHSVLEAEIPGSAVIEAVALVSPAPEFVKSVTIEARTAGGAWQVVAENHVVFRQAGGAEKMTVNVTRGPWQRLRCFIDDERSPPVPCTAMRVRAVAATRAPIIEWPLAMGERVELAGRTRFLLDLGAANLDVAELRFQAADAVFSRTCELIPAGDDPTGRDVVLARESLFRVAGEAGAVAELLDLPVQRRIATRRVAVVFHHGDSPPIEVTGVTLRCYPTVLAVHAAEPGAWRVLTGNPQAAAPEYDVASLQESLARTRGEPVTAGLPHEKEDFERAPDALARVDTGGADIALSAWQRRRLVEDAGEGIIRIEVDATILAACRDDLGDVRLVQNGRQIPYLVRPETIAQSIEPLSVARANDRKRPTLTRWKLHLPVEGLPAAEITAESPAQMFVRRMNATIERRDPLGNAWTASLGSVDWTKSDALNEPLRIALHKERLPRDVTVETDHGDNPPIEVNRWRLIYQAPVITAKLDGDAPLFLYYRNPAATPPQYDLRLVRDELLAAEAAPATLGDEEILQPGRAGHGSPEPTSPWLWVALAAVVATLALVIVRLLPKPAAANA